MKRILSVLRSTPVRAGFLLLAVGAAVFFVVREWDTVTSAVVTVGWLRVLAATGISVLYVLATALSWRALLADLGSRLPFGAAARIFFVSQVAKYLPGGVWNIVAAAELGRDHEVPARRSVTVMLTALMISCATGAVLAVIGLLSSPQARSDYWWVLVAIPVLLVVLAPPVLARIVALALRLTKRPPLEKNPTWAGLAAGAGWQVLAWLLAGWAVHLLAVPLGVPVSVEGYLLATGAYALAWTVGFLAIVVPAGVGVREVVLAAALAGYLDLPAALTVVLLSRIVLTVVDLALGLGVLLVRRRTSPQLTAISEPAP